MSSAHSPQRSKYRFQVSVIMERRQIRHGRWSVPQWDAVGVVAGEGLAGAEDEPITVHVDEAREQHLWPGFVLDLTKGSAESYWYNLVGKNPALYVVCQAEDGGRLVPMRVTAEYDAAAAHVEAEDEVFAVPIPPEIYRDLERYVVENYKPTPPRKRKRANWAQEALGGKRSR